MAEKSAELLVATPPPNIVEAQAPTPTPEQRVHIGSHSGKEVRIISKDEIKAVRKAIDKKMPSKEVLQRLAKPLEPETPPITSAEPTILEGVTAPASEPIQAEVTEPALDILAEQATEASENVTVNPPSSENTANTQEVGSEQLALTMVEDPLFKQMQEDAIANWDKNNQGVDHLSEQYRNFYFGQQGRLVSATSRMSLQDRVAQNFRSNYPEKYLQYNSPKAVELQNQQEAAKISSMGSSTPVENLPVIPDNLDTPDSSTITPDTTLTPEENALEAATANSTPVESMLDAPDSLNTPEEETNPPDNEKSNLELMQGLDINDSEIIDAVLKGSKSKLRDELIKKQAEVSSSKDATPVQKAVALDLQIALKLQMLSEYDQIELKKRDPSAMDALQEELKTLYTQRKNEQLPQTNLLTERMKTLGLDAFLSEKARNESERLKVPEDQRLEWQQNYVDNSLKNKPFDSFSEYLQSASKDEKTRATLLGRYTTALLMKDTNGDPDKATDEQKHTAAKHVRALERFLINESIKKTSKDMGLAFFIASLLVTYEMFSDAYKTETKSSQ